MFCRALRLASVCLGLLSANLPSPAAAEDFYAGKQIKFVIGVPPGGGYDLYGRLLARHLSGHIAGQPKVIIQQMVGADSLVATNYLFNVAARDGTYMGAVVNGIPFDPLFEGSNAQYDATKFNWIGNLNKEVNLLVLWHTAAANSVEDLRQKETILAATVGGAGSSHTFPRILNELVGTKLKAISGYDSSAQGFLAMERGEVEGRGMYWSSLISAQRGLYEAGRFKLLLQAGLEPHSALKDVPFVLDYARNEEDRALMRLLFASLTIGRPILAPPGVPPERIAILQQAFEATVNSPEFIEDARRSGVETITSSGAEVTALIKTLYAAPPGLIARARAILKQ